MSRIIIEVENGMHQQIKALAAIQGKSIKDFVLERIFVDDIKIPNKTTMKALKDAVTEKNLIKYKTKETMYKDLGL